MRTVLRWIRGRLIPATVTAAGVSLVMAGLLTYQAPAVALVPTEPPVAAASATAGPTLLPFPSVSPGAAPSASPPADRVASRVVVPALRIDLPVIRPPSNPNHYPFCDVAEFLPQLSQPGFGGTTYLYAHARTGMFLPILEESKRNNGQRMIGMLVQVYTSDDQLFLYEVTRVLRHQTTLDAAFAAEGERLMLQTSEGPRGTIEKTMLIATPLGSSPADPAAAHPVAHPVACQ